MNLGKKVAIFDREWGQKSTENPLKGILTLKIFMMGMVA